MGIDLLLFRFPFITFQLLRKVEQKLLLESLLFLFESVRWRPLPLRFRLSLATPKAMLARIIAKWAMRVGRSTTMIVTITIATNMIPPIPIPAAPGASTGSAVSPTKSRSGITETEKKINNEINQHLSK